ncbi:hypothetical protein HF888_11340 [Bermanella marisrubri]|uniref:Uncharacterized protein n=1 Tax=Bermanella marisrubri TaxID=207949 RepID=Q1N179_9GAMM|nr:hypothetical protein [Bermanella marisrubri]EAT11972.1 hypothetical protein RED65_11545 [Oceanobacter sp. RED65] [Bermanella marisrubri]QIZ84776.1 hypothetical protein HF888_11340 [Bermanella marisrubri]
MTIKKKWPFGIVTFSLLIVAFAIQYWPKSPCERLEQSISSGYFMQWRQPLLFIVLADRSQHQFSGASKQEACLMALEQLDR